MNNSVRRKGFHHPLPTSHFDEIDYVHSSYSFPEKLYIILENEDIDCVRWAPNGICFRILNEEVFLKKIMPQFFKQSKMTSFQRQLNSYGFRKISRGVDVGCYFHPKFQKDRTDLLLEVQRLPAKGSLESYEEVQFSQRKELSFDYNRSTGIRKKVKKDEKPVLKTTYLPPSTAASSPVSSISSDDCSVSSLSSGDVEPPKPVTTLNRYKGPYLFLGCGKPASLMQTEQFQQYRLYEQHCMNRLAEFQQEQMQYSIFPGISPAFIPYPAHEPSPYAYDDSDYNFENFHEDVYWSYVNYSPLPAAIESGNISTYPLTFFAQSSPSPSHEKQPSMEDWADSLMNMPWTSTGSDECYLI